MLEQLDLTKTMGKDEYREKMQKLMPEVSMLQRECKELGIPVLLWGPLDERPEADGTRLRDTQCGLFATGKVLRRSHPSVTA